MEQLNKLIQRRFQSRWTRSFNDSWLIPSLSRKAPFYWHQDKKTRHQSFQAAKKFLAQQFLNLLIETEHNLVDDGKGKRTVKRLQFIQGQAQKQQKQQSESRKKWVAGDELLDWFQFWNCVESQCPKRLDRLSSFLFWGASSPCWLWWWWYWLALMFAEDCWYVCHGNHFSLGRGNFLRSLGLWEGLWFVCLATLWHFKLRKEPYLFAPDYIYM